MCCGAANLLFLSVFKVVLRQTQFSPLSPDPTTVKRKIYYDHNPCIDEYKFNLLCPNQETNDQKRTKPNTSINISCKTKNLFYFQLKHWIPIGVRSGNTA
ncbi:hypothetical protein ACOSP7_000634 [Xanthoceras sorbifolium]